MVCYCSKPTDPTFLYKVFLQNSGSIGLKTNIQKKTKLGVGMDSRVKWKC